MKKIFSILILSIPLITCADVEICTIPLPVTKNSKINKKLLGTKHVYLKVDEKTYGMPYTIKRTYFGGDAFLYSEDPFRKDYAADEKCEKVKISKKRDRVEFSEKVKCIANLMAIPLGAKKEELAKRDWYPIFDYNAITNNCSSMVSYILACAGEAVNLDFNFDVGDEVPLSKMAKIVYPSNDSFVKNVEYSNYGEICQMAQAQCQ